ncbi:MAG: M15 family metallopeptidase [Actinobacteria bacterium]|nr:M15 family metallopeptidase [Actinomycetota bacterium]
MWTRLRRSGLRLVNSPRWRTAAALVFVLPLLVSPLGTDTGERVAAQTTAVAPPQAEFAPVGPGGVEPSDPAAQQQGTTAAAPEPDAPQPPVADTVEPVQPQLLVRPAEPVQPDGLVTALNVPGIRHLAGAVELDGGIQALGSAQQVKILVVDPVAFRPLTPSSTAQTKGVWERLTEGELVVRHDIAHHLQLPLGGDATVYGPSGETLVLRVGAFASNGAPPLADALVSWQVGAQLGAAAANLLVIAVSDDTAAQAIGRQLVEAIGGGDVSPVQPPTEQRARLVGVGAKQFQPFSYIDHGDGMITIDPAWVRKWIVSARLPIFGGVARCHRVMMPQLINALREVEARGLAHLIDRGGYGGCWVPRHILFDPNKPLSMHAWGLAVDFNVATNQYGARPTMDGRIVEIFQRWGFGWGGHWSTPDGMHFELRAVIQ